MQVLLLIFCMLKLFKYSSTVIYTTYKLSVYYKKMHLYFMQKHFVAGVAFL
jgi:hypothetical protein